MCFKFLSIAPDLKLAQYLKVIKIVRY